MYRRDIRSAGISGLSWTPDGEYLLFTKNGGGELWRIRAVSAKQERVSIPPMRGGIINLRVHPDGRRIAYTTSMVREELWVLENFLPE